MRSKRSAVQNQGITLSKSRRVLFLSVQKFEALPTGIRFDN